MLVPTRVLVPHKLLLVGEQNVRTAVAVYVRHGDAIANGNFIIYRDCAEPGFWCPMRSRPSDCQRGRGAGSGPNEIVRALFTEQ